MTITMPWQGTGSRRAVDRLRAVEAEKRQLEQRLADANRQIADLAAKQQQTYADYKFAQDKAASAEDLVVKLDADLDELRRRHADLWGQIKTVPPVVAVPVETPAEPTPVEVLPLHKSRLRVPSWAPSDAEKTQEIPLADRLVQGVAS